MTSTTTNMSYYTTHRDTGTKRSRLVSNLSSPVFMIEVTETKPSLEGGT